MVICDETNYSREARTYIQSDKWLTVFYPVETSPEVCKERAVLTGQPDLIPVIDEMWARFEPLKGNEEVFVGVLDDGTIVSKKAGDDRE